MLLCGETVQQVWAYRLKNKATLGQNFEAWMVLENTTLNTVGLLTFHLLTGCMHMASSPNQRQSIVVTGKLPAMFAFLVR
jgi:hypothetical protein